MKLKELQEQLSKFDPEQEVFIRIEDGEDGVTDVDHVMEATWVKEDPDDQEEKSVVIVSVY